MKNTIVVDTSIALKWVLSETDSHIATSLLAEWTKRRIDIVAPALLLYESANILYREARADRITFVTASNGLDVILKAVALECLEDSKLSVRAMELARQYGLPAAYDTHYLALAEREGCELWTADTRMWKAVRGQLNWVRNMSDHQHS